MKHGNRDLAPERPAQHDPNDRRKNEGWKRLTIWLTPQEADILQTLGSAWLEDSVKALLANVIANTERPLPSQAEITADPLANPAPVLAGDLAAAVLAERGKTIAILFRLGMTANKIAALLHLELSEVARVLSPAPEIFTLTEEPTAGHAEEQADLMRELDSLLAQGLSGTEIARQFNAAGRRTTSGVEYTGANLIRDWRRWKGTAI